MSLSIMKAQVRPTIITTVHSIKLMSLGVFLMHLAAQLQLCQRSWEQVKNGYKNIINFGK